jgi:hypothetical protein
LPGAELGWRPTAGEQDWIAVQASAAKAWRLGFPANSEFPCKQGISAKNSWLSASSGSQKARNFKDLDANSLRDRTGNKPSNTEGYRREQGSFESISESHEPGAPINPPAKPAQADCQAGLWA